MISHTEERPELSDPDIAPLSLAAIHDGRLEEFLRQAAASQRWKAAARQATEKPLRQPYGFD